MIPPTLTTDRLIIRAARPEDAEPVAAMWGDPEVVQFIGGQTRTPQDAWFAMARSRGMWPLLGFGFWIVEDRGTGDFLGEAGFADFKRGLDPDISHWPEAGWAFAKAAWGRGVASETVLTIHEWLDAERPGQSVCIIDSDNAPSRRVAEKSGYAFWVESNYGGKPVNVYRRNPPDTA